MFHRSPSIGSWTETDSTFDGLEGQHVGANVFSQVLFARLQAKSSVNHSLSAVSFSSPVHLQIRFLQVIEVAFKDEAATAFLSGSHILWLIIMSDVS